jgi:hypothetical protein
MGQTALLPAEDVFARKIRRLRPGANSRSWVPEASMLPTRPPKVPEASMLTTGPPRPPYISQKFSFKLQDIKFDAVLCSTFFIVKCKTTKRDPMLSTTEYIETSEQMTLPQRHIT